jgi:hypothetical protein
VRTGALDVKGRTVLRGGVTMKRTDLGTSGTTSPATSDIYESESGSENHKFLLGTRGTATGVNFYDPVSGLPLVRIFSDSQGAGTVDLMAADGTTVNLRLRGQNSTTPSFGLGQLALGTNAVTSANEKLLVSNSGIPIRLERSGVDTWELHQSAVQDGLYWKNITDDSYSFGINASGFVYGAVVSVGTNGAPASANKMVISNDGYPVRFERSGTDVWEFHQSAILGGFGFYNVNDAAYRLSLLDNGSISLGSNTGTAVLVGGTVTVNNTLVTANSRIFLTTQVTGGTVGSPYISARTASTSFTITSTSGTDTSTVAWMIVEP